VSKAKLEMDRSLTAQAHQEARDELEMDDQYDTSDICRMYKKQLMKTTVKLTEM
jgi:hypothetical protein